MFNIGDKLDKHNYTKGAIWCNENNAMIEVINGEYVIVAIPEPTVEELQAKVRAVRNSYLEKYVDPKQLVLVWEGMSVDERNIYSDYRRYLLDYTEVEDWYLSNPMTLDEWKNFVKPVEEMMAEPVEESKVIEDGLQREEKEIIDNLEELSDNELLIV